MKTCLVTLQHNERQWDLEVPASLGSDELVALLLRSLSLPATPSLRLFVPGLGLALSPAQSLAEAGVYDGAVLQLTAEVVASGPAVTDAVGDTPAQRWKSIAPEAPPAPAPSESEKPGFAWKKMDV